MHGLMNEAAIVRQVQDVLDASDVPGAAIALIFDGQRWATGVGWADPDQRDRLDASARFGTYSVTKTVIAAIVMTLVESGDVSLDGPIQDVVPGIPIDVPVSVRQVLNHTGGIRDYGGLVEYHAAVRQHPGIPWTAGEYLEKTLGHGLLFEPGEGWRYSNIGYMLLCQMIERVTGMSFREAVRHYVADSFGLRDFDVAEGLGDMAVLTPGYSTMLDPGGPAGNVIPRYHPGWVSHGLVTSTAPDLARFLDALFAGNIVGSDSLREMLRAIPVAETHPWMAGPSYGLGLMVDPMSRFGVVAGHTGGGPGYSTAAYHFPDVNGYCVTGVALVNHDGGDTATGMVFSMVDMLAEAVMMQKEIR